MDENEPEEEDKDKEKERRAKQKAATRFQDDAASVFACGSCGLKPIPRDSCSLPTFATGCG